MPKQLQEETFKAVCNKKWFIQTIACGVLMFAQGIAACPGITITRTSAPYFILDSNKPCVEGPSAAYMAIRIRNTSGAAYTNAYMRFDSITVSTKFKLLAPSDSSHYIGNLAAGASITLFFFLKSPCVNNDAGTFHYTFHYNSGSTCTFSTSITSRNAISSAAGGTVLSSVSATSALGSIVTDTVTQSMGNVGTNDEMEFQPASLLTFRADAYELFGVKVLASNIPGIAAGRRDSIFFRATGGANPGNVKFVYYFKVKSPGVSTKLTPFAGTPQGGSNYKYKYDTTSAISFPVATQLPLITKRASQYYNVACDSVKFTITVKNNATVPISIDRIRDKLPPGVNYKRTDLASGITGNNSTLIPESLDSGTIYFIGGTQSAYQPYLSYYIPARDSIQAIYWVKLGCSNSIRLDTNLAVGYIDQYPFDTARATICVGCVPLSADNLNFSGRYADGQSNLNWEVPDAGTLHRFELYRADQSGTYQKLHETTALNKRETIHFSDDVGAIETNASIFYKLKHADVQSGVEKNHYLTIQPNKNRSASDAPIFFENPVLNTLDIKFRQKQTNISLQLVNTAGKQLAFVPLSSAQVGEVISMNMESIRPGVYNLILHNASGKSVFKIIRQ